MSLFRQVMRILVRTCTVSVQVSFCPTSNDNNAVEERETPARAHATSKRFRTRRQRVSRLCDGIVRGESFLTLAHCRRLSSARRTFLQGGENFVGKLCPCDEQFRTGRVPLRFFSDFFRGVGGGRPSPSAVGGGSPLPLRGRESGRERADVIHVRLKWFSLYEWCPPDFGSRSGVAWRFFPSLLTKRILALFEQIRVF